MPIRPHFIDCHTVLILADDLSIKDLSIESSTFYEDGREELYNIAKDLGEVKDISKKPHGNTLKHLRHLTTHRNRRRQAISKPGFGSFYRDHFFRRRALASLRIDQMVR